MIPRHLVAIHEVEATSILAEAGIPILEEFLLNGIPALNAYGWVSCGHGQEVHIPMAHGIEVVGQLATRTLLVVVNGILVQEFLTNGHDWHLDILKQFNNPVVGVRHEEDDPVHLINLEGSEGLFFPADREIRINN